LNLSPDYTLSYAVIPSNEQGIFSQGFLINNTKDKTKNAVLALMSSNDRSLLNISSSEFKNYVENMLYGAFRLGGAKEKESYNLTTHYQQNMTIHALDVSDSKNPKSGNLTYIGFWSLDNLNYFILFASEKELTKNIVETLEVKDSSRNK
jgi:hypothetical protein